MLAANLFRLSVRSAPTLRTIASNSAGRNLHVVKATTSFRTISTATHRRGLATSPSSSPRARKTTTTKKATKPKTKVSSKSKASSTKSSKEKKPKKEKLKPWQARGADGKLLPLPSATKPSRRSAFILFVSDKFPGLRSDPSMMKKNKEGVDKVDVVKITRSLGNQWKSMSDSEKRPYNQRAEADKARYEKELEQWRANLTSEDIRRQNAYILSLKRAGKKGGTGRLRDPAKPKSPQTAFFAFFQDLRAKDASLANGPVVDAAKRAGSLWKDMSKDEKEPFELKAAGAREQYQKDMEEWKKQSVLL